MDVTKFFEPVQKFTGYLVSRFSLLIVSLLLVAYTTSRPVTDEFKKIVSYSVPVDVLDGLGIKGENQPIFISIVALLLLVSILELHEKLLHFLNRFAPVKFSTRSNSGPDPFESFGPLVWRGYCKQLNYNELRELYLLTLTKVDIEARPISRRAEVFDFIPGWIFLLLLIYFFAPGEFLISGFAVLKLAFVLVLTGLVWELFSGSDHVYQSFRVSREALSILIDKRLHDFEELSDEQREMLVRYCKMVPTQPWRVPVLYFPWKSYAGGVLTYAKVCRDDWKSGRWSRRPWIRALLDLLEEQKTFPALARFARQVRRSIRGDVQVASE